MRFPLITCFILVFFETTGQTVPSYLVSNDVPYASKSSSLTFSPVNSDYVLTFDDEWKYRQTHQYAPEDTTEWLSIRELSGAYSSAFKIAFKNKLSINNFAQRGKVILHIPSSPFQYDIKINGQKIPKNFPYQLSNNIELTSQIKEGSNFITLQCKLSANLKRFLKGIYVIILRDKHIANICARGYFNTKTNYHDLSILGKTFNFAETSVQGYSIIPSMYNENDKDLKNYLSYQTNKLTFDSAGHPFPHNKYKFHDFSLPQESKDFFSVIVPKSQKWSLEYPNVYNISEELLDDKNNFVAAYSTKTGFKNIDITQGKLFVNRKKAKIKAINYAPETPGDYEKIKKEISSLKKNNINALYLSITDINGIIIDFCNKYGIYVMLDVSPSNFKDSDYLATTKDIFTHVVLTYGNHPSLFALAIKSPENTDPQKLYDTYKMIDDVLNDYSMELPLVVRLSNPGLLKILEKKDRLILGFDDHGDPDVVKIAKKYDYPILIFNQSIADLGVGQSVERYINILKHGYPSNIQGLVFKGDILTDSLQAQKLKYELQEMELQWIQNTSFQIAIKNKLEYTNFSEFNLGVVLMLGNRKVAEIEISDIHVSPGTLKLYQAKLNCELLLNKVYELTMTARLKEDNLWGKKGYILSEERVLIEKEKNGTLKKILIE
ncbi:hypothetical protein QQ020_16815 [Fulvivirgaceae bacterium BMA12]|uniref:beta-galactosidase n=1 Tax=Agaribacillus aureus TaxID=3051825 RepID=A0ABT8L9P2_9BACT|nr:hypothetical protein [Fulvivirgaceae bacterium BMA12]